MQGLGGVVTGLRFREWSLDESQVADGTIAEVRIDALDDLCGPVLHFDGAWPIHAQNESCAWTPFVSGLKFGIGIDLPGPFETLRQSEAGEIRTGNFAPVRQQRCR